MLRYYALTQRLYGNYLPSLQSVSQINLLLERESVKELLFISDSDAIRDMKKIANNVKKYFPKILVTTILSGKDPDDCEPQELIDSIKRATTPEKFSLNLVQKGFLV